MCHSASEALCENHVRLWLRPLPCHATPGWQSRIRSCAARLSTRCGPQGLAMYKYAKYIRDPGNQAPSLTVQVSESIQRPVNIINTPLLPLWLALIYCVSSLSSTVFDRLHFFTHRKQQETRKKRRNKNAGLSVSCTAFLQSSLNSEHRK